jgi:predicted secreted protein
MATLTGENGKVMFGDDSGGASTQVAEVRSWTIEHTKDVIENTAMGAGGGARTYLSGLTQFTGTMECMYDTAQTSASVFDPANDANISVEFFPATTGVKYVGDVIVTSVSRTASFDDLVTVSCSFQGNGVLHEEAI